MNKDWRPDDWRYMWSMNMLDSQGNEYRKQTAQSITYEDGASAMLAALIKWLFEPCTEHPLPSPICTVNSVPVIYPIKYSVYHYLCPKCMESLKKMEAKDVAI
jgi:hypothetical protein